MEVDNDAYRLTEDGSIRDLERLARSVNAGDERITGAVVELITPLTTYQLPSSAVLSGTDGGFCVVDEAGSATSVEIVGAGAGSVWVAERLPDRGRREPDPLRRGNDMRLVASELFHRFDKTRDVLRGVSLTVQADKTSTAVVAPSGSGKTTLLAIIGGLLPPTSGEVHVRSGSRSMSVRDQVSWVFQTTGLLSRRSAWDNAAMGASALGRPRQEIQRSVDEALAAVGLSKNANERAGILSGGEAQRLGVARAVATGLPFILADEPTGQLDRANSRLVADALFEAVRVAEGGLVLVTHDLDLASRCDRTLSLVDGKLRE